jgi:hypothetical protein
MVTRSSFLVLFFLVAATFAPAQLSISPARLPDAGVGINYYQELHSEGGSTPFTWTIRGQLPPGITFDAPTSTLAGIPTDAGDYRFVILLTDSSRHRVSRSYLLRVTAGNTITLVWTRLPQVLNGAISAEVEVSNPGREVFDVTFIAVAVNEIGRATALGYQRFPLSPGKQRIPFATTLPRGAYVVHADAVGEIARSGTIRRARLQTHALTVP